MNTKHILLIIGIFFALSTAAGGIYYFSSTSRVTFDFKQSNHEISLYRIEDETDAQLQTLRSTDTVRLSHGKYYFVPKGERVAQSAEDFTVGDGNLTITVDPSYSETVLSALGDAATPGVKDTLARSYSIIPSNYALARGTTLDKGQWYAGLLTKTGTDEMNTGDVYRVLLQRQNDEWRVIVPPQLITRAAEYPDIPVEIIDQLNKVTI